MNSLHCTLLTISDLTCIWRNGNLHQKNKPSKHVSTLNRDWTPHCSRSSPLCRLPRYPLPSSCLTCLLHLKQSTTTSSCLALMQNSGKAQLISYMPNMPSRILELTFLYHVHGLVLSLFCSISTADGLVCFTNSPTVAMWTIPNCNLPVLWYKAQIKKHITHVCLPSLGEFVLQPIFELIVLYAAFCRHPINSGSTCIAFIWCVVSVTL